MIFPTLAHGSNKVRSWRSFKGKGRRGFFFHRTEGLRLLPLSSLLLRDHAVGFRRHFIFAHSICAYGALALAVVFCDRSFAVATTEASFFLHLKKFRAPDVCSWWSVSDERLENKGDEAETEH